jgi:ubiquinone/menaquinone biosynthesis C-methylase UbiE
VTAHYDRGALASRLDAALAAAGLDDRRLTPRDLAPVDQFHTGGLRATIDLATALAPKRGSDVIDIGCGLGGAARYLATTFDCHVRGIDASPSFIDAARLLTRRSALEHAVQFDVGDALALPYAAGTFDIAWTQHAAMNIRDRPRMYAEIHRVLRAGGRLAISDVLAGTGPLHFPVPWASNEHESFLMTPSALRDALEAAGFRVTSWIDRTATSLSSLELLAPSPSNPSIPSHSFSSSSPLGPGLGLGLVMGDKWPFMVANLTRNLREGRALVAEIVLEKPA